MLIRDFKKKSVLTFEELKNLKLDKIAHFGEFFYGKTDSQFHHFSQRTFPIGLMDYSLNHVRILMN